MTYMQADLFEITETTVLRGEIRSLEKTVDNVRKGVFSRHDELSKAYLSIKYELDKLKDAFLIMKKQMAIYETILFPTSGEESGPVAPSMIF